MSEGSSGQAAAAGFPDQQTFNPIWHGVYGFPSEPRSEAEVTELLRKEPAFVARVVASTFEFFGPGPELCRKVALQLAAEWAAGNPEAPKVDSKAKVDSCQIRQVEEICVAWLRI